jgi:cytoskeletal protein RodZ
MNGARIGKKPWILVGLLLLLAGCASAERSAKSPSSEHAGGTAEQAYPQGSQDYSVPSPASVEVSSDGASRAPAEPSGMAPTQAAPAPPPAPAKAGSATTASKPAAEAPASRPRTADAAPTTPAPSTRPGLGTEFGEARVSRVHDVTFVRDSGRPFAVASLNYNDRKGVDALAASARRDSSRSVSAASGAVTISIRDANGDPLEAVKVADRTLVVGQAGQRYTIVLQNHTGHRFEAVGTVDGLDVINGKPGTFENRGYVLMPFATLEIEGFRTSTAQVAAFRFAAVADSYAAQTGSARNVGVIGIAFFNERGDAFVPESEVRLRETASPFPADPRFAQPPRR